jgi:hypothetical protein
MLNYLNGCIEGNVIKIINMTIIIVIGLLGCGKTIYVNKFYN